MELNLGCGVSEAPPLSGERELAGRTVAPAGTSTPRPAGIFSGETGAVREGRKEGEAGRH